MAGCVVSEASCRCNAANFADGIRRQLLCVSTALQSCGKVSDGGPGLQQRLEPMLIQAFVAKLAVDTLVVAILHRSARPIQEMANPLGVCPAP